MVGTTLTGYQPKPRCVNLKQSKFHDFCPDSRIQFLSVPWHRALGAGGCWDAADLPQTGGVWGVEPPVVRGVGVKATPLEHPIPGGLCLADPPKSTSGLQKNHNCS